MLSQGERIPLGGRLLLVDSLAMLTKPAAASVEHEHLRPQQEVRLPPNSPQSYILKQQGPHARKSNAGLIAFVDFPIGYLKMETF